MSSSTSLYLSCKARTILNTSLSSLPGHAFPPYFNALAIKTIALWVYRIISQIIESGLKYSWKLTKSLWWSYLYFKEFPYYPFAFLQGTPNTPYGMQIKDMALKMSGAYRQFKPCTGSNAYKKGQRPFPDFDTISEGVPYPYLQPGSSSSTPAWDFTTTGHPIGGSDSRFTRAFSGDRAPGGLESISAQSGEVMLENENEPKEWMAQVEPGVQITFVSLPHGGNDLKRIRFRYVSVLYHLSFSRFQIVVQTIMIKINQTEGLAILSSLHFLGSEVLEEDLD